jgi:hypothetical protein
MQKLYSIYIYCTSLGVHKVLHPVHLDLLLQQKVHLVEPEYVYSRRAGWVQDGTQEPKDVLHPGVVAGLHQVPVR